MNNEPSSVANEATSDAAAAVDNNAGATFDNVAPVPLETELDDPAAIHNSSLRNRRSSGSGSGSANGTNGNNGALATNNTKMKHQGSQLSLPKKKSSVFGASSNLVNSIVGAGIIGIPYALRMSGLWAGLFLLLLVGLFTDKSLRILIEQASFHPRFRSLPAPVLTFEDLASYPFGKFGSGFVLFNMFVMAYGAMVAYLLIIKDTVPTVMGYEHGTHLLERNFILILVSLLVMLPLSMQRDMASLSITSTISVAADVVLVVFVAAYSPIQDTVATNGGIGRIMQTDSVHSTLFVGLGILSTAMACQHSAFIVANSLNDKTRRRWKWVTNQSIALAAVLCAILGVCGYLGFLDDTQGDVLNNFPVGSVEADGARILLALTMVFTYPVSAKDSSEDWKNGGRRFLLPFFSTIINELRPTLLSCRWKVSSPGTSSSCWYTTGTWTPEEVSLPKTNPNLPMKNSAMTITVMGMERAMMMMMMIMPRRPRRGLPPARLLKGAVSFV
mmetsp:Transcript_17805/g.36238  ORF Transcript_17805/g.36238 Transcript_17805/m.36238 type:complete len:501 (-) Transcript_17805:985-2487(-)